VNTESSELSAFIEVQAEENFLQEKMDFAFVPKTVQDDF